MSQKGDKTGKRTMRVVLGLAGLYLAYVWYRLWYLGGLEEHRLLRELFWHIFDWRMLISVVAVMGVFALMFMLAMYFHRNDPEPPKCPHCGQVLPEGHDQTKADKGGL